jgi:formylglycine-generating enzyme required for sulfatase activity
MGAQREDRQQPGFDPDAAPNEGPVTRITLAPFFLSKYETTQAQWLRFTPTNPSDHHAESNSTGTLLGLRNPVEQVSWNDCATFLARLDLAFPTEAQWEFAARAGTTTVWSTGEAKESIAGSANLADSYCKNHGGPGAWIYDDWLDDGYTTTAPIGTYLPNPFGFHDMIGNVWEWCRDEYGGYDKPVKPSDGERIVPGNRHRPVRGGSYADVALNARTALRMGFGLPDRDSGLGLRPARAVAP